MAWLSALTEFGDLAVVMPLAAMMLLWLLLMHSPRGAVWWAIAVALCGVLTAILKIYFYGCAPTADLRGPSGHTSLSTLVYGAMTLVIATESGGLPRMITIGAGAGFILAIAASRVLLHTHDAPEVAFGLAIGIAALTLFSLVYPRYRPAKVWLPPLIAAGGALMLVLHGRVLHADELLREIAGYLRIHCA